MFSLCRVLLFSTIAFLPLSAEAQNRDQSQSQPGASQAHSAINSKILKDLRALVDEAEKARAADPLFLRDLRDLMVRHESSQAKFMKDLRALVDEAEKARAADPLFLRDLRDLMAERILSENFRDGVDLNHSGWHQENGKFYYEKGYGLRLVKESNFGAEVKPAVMSKWVHIPNAFTFTTTFSSWNEKGDYSVTVIQGKTGTGYRVQYTWKITKLEIKEGPISFIPLGGGCGAWTCCASRPLVIA